MDGFLNALRKYSAPIRSKTAAILLGRSFGLGALWLFAPWWAFFIIALFLFARSQSKLYSLFGLFTIVIALTWAADSWLMFGIEGTPLMDIDFNLRIFLALIFGFLFFFLFGIKELFFVRRREFALVATTISFFLAVFFTLWSLTPGRLILYIMPFAVAAIFLGSSLSEFSTNIPSRSSVFIYFSILAFLMAELLWALTYAPFSTINASILLSLFFFTVNFFYFVFAVQ